jgi:uncharacterized protein (TIGR02453 family)
VFKGFSKETFEFLRHLGENNNKEWFERHRNQYREYLITPLTDLVGELEHFMLLIDDAFETRPVVGKTLSRIYRDIRFSPRKELFRNRMWITFKRPRKDWQDAPAYFFEVAQAGYRYGMGFYGARPGTMLALRQSIKRDSKTFASKSRGLTNTFSLEGDLYKKKLDCETVPSGLLPFYRRKSFYLVRPGNIDDLVLSPKLSRALMKDFKRLAPLYTYLNERRQALDGVRCPENSFSVRNGIPQSRKPSGSC